MKTSLMEQIAVTGPSGSGKTTLARQMAAQRCADLLGASAVLHRFGNVREVIERDGFRPVASVHTIVEGETPTTMAKSTGLGIIELATQFENLQPDIVLTVADRFEKGVQERPRQLEAVNERLKSEIVERTRVEKELAGVVLEMQRLTAKLGNAGFLAKAAPEIFNSTGQARTTASKNTRYHTLKTAARFFLKRRQAR